MIRGRDRHTVKFSPRPLGLAVVRSQMNNSSLGSSLLLTLLVVAAAGCGGGSGGGAPPLAAGPTVAGALRMPQVPPASFATSSAATTSAALLPRWLLARSWFGLRPARGCRILTCSNWMLRAWSCCDQERDRWPCSMHGVPKAGLPYAMARCRAIVLSRRRVTRPTRCWQCRGFVALAPTT